MALRCMGLRIHHAFASEKDPAAKATIQANFRPEVFYDDIKMRNITGMPHVDLYHAGFPCQPFSIAGVSKKNALGRPHGFLCDTQGTLFFDTAQFIAHHRPAAFVLENVKNLEHVRR